MDFTPNDRGALAVGPLQPATGVALYVVQPGLSATLTGIMTAGEVVHGSSIHETALSNQSAEDTPFIGTHCTRNLGASLCTVSISSRGTHGSCYV